MARLSSSRSIELKILWQLVFGGLEVLGILVHAAVVVAILPPVFLAFKVIIARRAFLIAIRGATELDDFIDPPLFRFRLSVDGRVAIFAGVFNALRNVEALGLQHESHVELE